MYMIICVYVPIYTYVALSYCITFKEWYITSYFTLHGYTHIHEFMHAYILTHVPTCLHAYVHTYVHTFVCVCIHPQKLHKCT